MLNSYLNAGLVLTVLGTATIALRIYQHQFTPHPELTRKLLHILMGLVTLSFPWLFDSVLPVVGLASLAVVWLLALRFYPPLKETLGSVLGSVDRKSLGEVYFPIAVALVFWLSQGNPLLFGIPILMLALADAVAALIGVRYGQVHYTTSEGQKSAEGSITFFTVAFLTTHVPLLLLSDTGRAESLLIALILGLLVMVLEAVAWRGLDNLFIPVGGFLLLQNLLTMTVPDLLVRLAVTIVLVGFTIGWRNRTTLNDSALLGAALVGYLSWSLGGWRWLLPPLILFLSYPLLVSWIDQEKTPLTAIERQMMTWLPEQPNVHRWERVHDIHSVLSVCAAGLLWLVITNAFNRSFLSSYTLAFAANLAIVGVAGFSPLNYWQGKRWLQVAIHTLQGWLLVYTPFLLLEGLTTQSIETASIEATLIGLAGTGLAALAFYLSQPLLQARSKDTLSWLSRAVYTTIASLLGLLPLWV